MEENFQNIKELINYSKRGILSKVILKDNINVTLFCMAKDTEISEHTSIKKGFVYIIEGAGTFLLEEKEIKMAPGVLIYMEKNMIHSLRAIKNTSFLLFLVN